MPRTTSARPGYFMHNRGEAVRLPNEVQFTTSEGFIRKDGDKMILAACPKDWSAYGARIPRRQKKFMEQFQDVLLQQC